MVELSARASYTGQTGVFVWHHQTQLGFSRFTGRRIDYESLIELRLIARHHSLRNNLSGIANDSIGTHLLAFDVCNWIRRRHQKFIPFLLVFVA